MTSTGTFPSLQEVLSDQAALESLGSHLVTSPGPQRVFCFCLLCCHCCLLAFRLRQEAQAGGGPAAASSKQDKAHRGCPIRHCWVHLLRPGAHTVARRAATHFQQQSLWLEDRAREVWGPPQLEQALSSSQSSPHTEAPGVEVAMVAVTADNGTPAQVSWHHLSPRSLDDIWSIVTSKDPQ